MTNIYREYEANTAKTLRVVQGTCAEPICKKLGLIAMVSISLNDIDFVTVYING